MHKKIKAIGFDPAPPWHSNTPFIPETSKEIVNGTCPGHHNAIVLAVSGNWVLDEDNGETIAEGENGLLHWERTNP